MKENQKPERGFLVLFCGKSGKSLKKIKLGLDNWLLLLYSINRVRNHEQFLEKYPSWPKGLPWKGSRSLIAARGFKSLLLRSSVLLSGVKMFQTISTFKTAG